MKHIYKFSIVLLTVFTFIGCNVDDDDSVTVLPMKELTASLSQQEDVIRIADDATSYDLVINFSEALPSYSTIEYSLDGGATTISSASSGDNTLVIPIAFDEDKFFRDVVLSDFIVVNAAARRFSTSITGNSSLRIARQGTIFAAPGSVEISVTWSNPAKDLDVFLVTGDQDLGGVLIDDSQGVTTTEQVVLPADQEGVFSLFMYEWSSDYPVDYEINYVFEDGQVLSFDSNITSDSFQFTISKLNDGAQMICYINKIE
ncbi:hypothetical protein N9K11_00135 [bacterium]|nr:hypothetical protein [Flavobacteriaceae bacterium]MDA9073415.1 hypothetical protein [bacterium]MDA9254174.1 hypothetical protein [Flavobacteriaceae bacterium]MDA9328143.1 hypothetical protein [Flavobacteriaceae bacterium]MDB4025067.1 hypothetical protein [Flavobacteriaceae bacterium]